MKEYFKAIKAEFPYVGVREKKFLNDFKSNVVDTIEQELSYKELIDQFGEPTDVANQYFDEVNIKEYKSKISIRKKVLILTILLCLVGVTVFITSFLEGRKSYIDREVTEVIEVGDEHGN